jgi:sodium/pantothenate symporter
MTFLLAANQSNAALVTFLVYTLSVFGLAAAANQLLKNKNFLNEYFLGSRSLGVWAFALTFAATSSSGGSFTGFPSKIYSHGWVLALWIGSYMVVPICTMGILGKRINQIARISGAITVPDVIRDRFGSVVFGLLATLLIVFFMSFNLVAQFKAGCLILQTLLEGVGPYESAGEWMAQATSGIGFLDGVSGQYLVCLFAFGVAVVIYTTYGGFHAVVWTDVMQGIVMVFGVLILLPLALWQVGGLENATRKMAKMTPPSFGHIAVDSDQMLPPGNWIEINERLLRVTGIPLTSEAIQDSSNAEILARWQSDYPAAVILPVLEIQTPNDRETILADREPNKVRDDVIILADAFAVHAFPDKGQSGTYVTGPGPHLKNIDGFLPLSLAISFFFMWAISGSGQPSNMVRLMAFNNTRTLRRSIMTVAVYYTLIYFPLVIIFCCARVLLPGMDAESDRIMPAMAVFLTENAGVGWLAGLLVAAPFAAVMSTVDSFLLMISSALVRDIYQRNLSPDAHEKTLKRLSYLTTLVVGTAAMLGAVNPPQFLQDIIVYTGSGLAACFLAPVVLGVYWPRINTAGAISGMLAGFLAHLSMYFLGYVYNRSFFNPYRLFDFDPIIVGLFVSFATVILVTLITPPPPRDIVEKYFYRKPA